MKLIVAGSRSFSNYKLLCWNLDKIINGNNEVEIVSGTAQGADKLGEYYAQTHGFAVKQFPANWNKFGKSAGYRRNEEMAKYATHCIVFWDGESRGTKHMIDLANKHNLELTIVRF